MRVLQRSVGEKAPNIQEDVKTVQRLFKTKGINPGPADGICGQKTIRAILQFQSIFFSRPDGVIEPGRKTWNHLSSGSYYNKSFAMEWR